MCGLCGRLNFDGSVPSEGLIRKMCDRLVHRGPDQEGIHVAPGIGLGQRRLAIIDLKPEAGAPLANEDGSVWVTYNGEIYNYRALRSDLQKRGHVFRTGTDTEVLVHLYEEYGRDLVQHLNGMFAFAIWDANQRTLLAARDRLGKKPFVYARTPNAFLFASEIKSLAANPELTLEPDFAALDAYLSFQYVPSPLSAFAGVRKLPPGSLLECDAAGNVNVTQYWAPPAPAKTNRSRTEVATQLRGALRAAVERRLMSDVPLGAFLSGGIDSGAVVALMTELGAGPVQTFSIGFTDYAHSELPWARLTAEKYKTDHHEMVVQPDPDIVQKLVYLYDEPFADSSAVPTWYVSQLARQNVTVALTGDGGDESFAGYDAYRRMAMLDSFDRVPAPLRSVVGGGVAAVLDRLPTNRLAGRAHLAATMVGAEVPDRYLLQMMTLKPHEKRRWYAESFQQYALADAATHLEQPPAWDDSVDLIDWMRRHDQRFYLPDCLMVKTDIASMAHGLEVRCPLLDHEVVELAASIPTAWKLNGNGGKQILKEAVEDLLPPAIRTKPKTGFGMPLAQWLRGPFSDLLKSNLLDDRARRRGLLKPAEIARAVDEHERGRRDWSNRLWALLMLELWFRTFID
jgi:asparagine synthase (glutamine-hydrolysing)